MQIAVVGLSSLFPGSSDVDGFFQDILAGRDRITKVPRTHWLIEDYYDPDPRAPDKIYVDRGGFLDPIDFDPMRWGIPPSILPATDTTQLLSLVVAERALADAFGDGEIDRDRVSVMLGVTGAQKLLGEMNSRLQRPIWASALREMGMSEAQVDEACARISSRYVPWQESTFPGVLGNVVAGRIANRLDLGGTNCVTDAACASAFGALNMALNELVSRQSDVVICGGADTMNDPFMFECFAKTTALSKSGDVRPFDAGADGTMLGEGVAMVVLMRLEDALAQGRSIHAVIRGLGTSSDGRAKSVYAPLPSGQAKALRRAYERAGYGPETVELVEAHGTGTAAGDAAELEALLEVFEGAAAGSCALGSVKAQIGHTKAAAGAAGLIKAVLALRHGVIPPTIKVQTPTEALTEDGPFYLSTRARPWIRPSDHPRRASVSAFGFGGANFHVTLEEHEGPGRAPRVPMGGAELVVLGGEARALAAEVRALLEDARRPGMLRWLAAETQRRYAGGPARLAIVAEGEDDLAEKLELALPFLEKGEPFSAPGGLEVSVGEAAGEPVAFMFPGQGSQHLEMGAALAMRFEAARAVWDRAADLALGEEPLHRVVFPPPTFDAAEREAQAARLTATEWAQPALGAASAATLAVLRSLGVEAAAFCGHSFGEVSALFAAGAIGEGDLLRIARKRGELMRDASSIEGAMTAVSARLEDVRRALPGCDVTVANHNHPEQVVLSGATEEIERAEAKLRERKLRCSRLEVATAFHSPLVAGACEPFAAFLAGIPFSAPIAPVYSNASAAPHGADARAALAAQIAEPVRFVEEIEAMHAAGIRTFVEVGPGSVLTALVSRILKGRPHRAIALDRKGADGVRAFLLGIAKLVAAGVPMQLGALGAGERAPIDPRTIVEPRMTVKLSGANAGKPYPPPSDAVIPDARTATVPSRSGATHAIGGSADGETMAAPKPLPKPPVSAPIEEKSSVTPQRSGAPTASAAPRPSADAALVQAFLETQRQSAEAHAAYQRAVADAHTAFLRSSEAAMSTIAALLAGSPPAELAPAMLAALPPAPVAAPPIVAAPSPIAPPVVVPPVVASPAAPPASPEAPALDLSALMMEVVAEKTGYPAAMLSPSMELESDLGVDSIKRVEILAALRERAPRLPELDPAELGKLRTLEEITRLLGASSPSLPRPLPRAGGEGAPALDLPALDLSALMMEVVAEKTGYPAAMLSPSMELESDLGVDSIKRVEILAALRERAPGLPELDPAELGKLRTLEEITRLLGASSPSLPRPLPRAGGEGARELRTTGSIAPPVDLSALMMEVVAEKTGYPAAMLSPSMELESDLGVDSIKRVEILAALRERAPGLPELDPAELGKLRTLEEITRLLGASTRPAPRPAPEVVREARRLEPRAIDRAVATLVSAPLPGLAPVGLFGARSVAITGDGRGIAERLARRLGAEGIAASVVDPLDERALDGAGALVVLAGLKRGSASDACREAFDAARRVARRFGEEGGLFVTVQDTGGGLGLEPSERAAFAGLTGLAKTAALEWPRATVRAIDVASALDPELVAERLARELLGGGAAREVGIDAGGARRVPSITHASLPASSAITPPTVVASGGARGVTAACLLALARHAGGRYLLLGRSELVEAPAHLEGKTGAALKRALLEEAAARGARPSPREIDARARALEASREIAATLADFAAIGAEARYAAVDVRDRAALASALGDARRAFGPFTTLVHGAGVLADRLLADKRPEDFERVFATKVDGLDALLEATASDPLDTLLFFSSVAARYGNAGQSDYAMANAVLDAIAAREAAARPSARVRALAWGPWEGGMVTPELASLFASRGVSLIDLERGADAFVREATASGVANCVLGAELAGAQDSSERRVEVSVSRRTHGYLVDHVVKDVPVVPVVLVIEWIARAARALKPELCVARVRDVAVLRGLPLARFDEGARFEIALRLIGNGHGATFAAEVRDARGACYRAEVDLLPELPAGAPPRPTPASLEPRSAPVYGGCLFHGERFRVIRRLDGVGEAGAAGELVGTRSVGWGEGGWETDPALFDGGLQLAVLWSERRLGGAALPTGLEALCLYREGPIEGAVRAIAYGHTAASGRAVCDVVFVDEDGRAVAELRGVETHVRPGTRADAARAR